MQIRAMKANKSERDAAILSVNLWEMALGTSEGLYLSLKKREGNKLAAVTMTHFQRSKRESTIKT